jgi:hypothetical protein
MSYAHFLGAPRAATNATAVSTFPAVMLRYPRMNTLLPVPPAGSSARSTCNISVSERVVQASRQVVSNA